MDHGPTPPDAERLLDAVDVTWPAAEQREVAGWRLRRGVGGGKRVSAASALAAGSLPDIGAAVSGLAAWGQQPLFRVTPGEEALDDALHARGYAVIDPVVIYCAPAVSIDDGADQTARVIRVETPLRIVDEIWAEGGIGPGRRAVMDRPAGPRAVLLARVEDRPAGVAFVAIDDGIAMIHAIEVGEVFRRKGAGGALLRGAARFALEHDAPWLALAVTEANAAAHALYEGLGMTVAARYHYRVLD
ncbi:GNAT family N-acetyltransferase [Limibaculum sp. M0105]|uniref:GNAT family N-acetyltransferase n=1 Tax=Thermohalobaculum xanthum TaxID=2753746 RepID=A0A8J7SJL2_9RHOB|nr:GNAT family N-acetyltransferase [Thermohalobaculum xanthum]MBK0401045.1 GNAT family N-acetyltransferase [Thermohalobaculum xanthum]